MTISGLEAYSVSSQLRSASCWGHLVFLYVTFGPRRILWLQLSRIVWFFPPAHFQPRGLLWRQLLGIVWFLCLSVPGLEGYSIPSCQGLVGLSLCQIQTSGDILAQLLGIIFFLLVHFGLPRLPLSEIVWSLCLRISDLRGYSYPAVGQCPIIFVCQ